MVPRCMWERHDYILFLNLKEYCYCKEHADAIVSAVKENGKMLKAIKQMMESLLLCILSLAGPSLQPSNAGPSHLPSTNAVSPHQPTTNAFFPPANHQCYQPSPMLFHPTCHPPMQFHLTIEALGKERPETPVLRCGIERKGSVSGMVGQFWSPPQKWRSLHLPTTNAIGWLDDDDDVPPMPSLPPFYINHPLDPAADRGGGGGGGKHSEQVPPPPKKNLYAINFSYLLNSLPIPTTNTVITACA